jgi:hypothetical protein
MHQAEKAARPLGLARFAEKSLRRSGIPGKHASGPEQAAEKGLISSEIPEKQASGAEARLDFVGFMRGLKPRLPPYRVFPQPVKARADCMP